MSWIPCDEENAENHLPQIEPQVEMVILPRTGDIGNFEVHRALPFKDRRMVGPFIFWDQMGPGEFLAGQGIDVRPHPHIGLSTVTYLFDGEIMHRDSLGNQLAIKAGDVNLMTAGQGIVHSERTGVDTRQNPSRLYGIQSWLAQPKQHEHGAPAFEHIGVSSMPTFDEKGVRGRVILGEYEGLKSPIPLQWNTLYVDAALEPGAKLNIPRTTEERAIYVLTGEIEIGGVTYAPEQMMILRPGDDVIVQAKNTAHNNVRLMILGGATMDGPRYIYWNFVASTKERLEEAKQDWQAGKFPTVAGDEKEFIPLPSAV